MGPAGPLGPVAPVGPLGPGIAMNPETDAAVASRLFCKVACRFARFVTDELVASIRELAIAIAPALVSIRLSRAENSGVPMNNAPDVP